MNAAHLDKPSEIEPDWHKEELLRRIMRLEAGQEPMMPLAQAKILLRQDIAKRKAVRNIRLNHNS